MEEIIQLDWSLFQLVHTTLKNDFFDILLPILRERNIWIPLYIFIIGFAFYNNSMSKAFFLIFGLVLTVVTTDVISSQVIKKAVKRARPCHIQTDLPKVYSLVECGSGYSFPSSHASNHFAIAFYLIFCGFTKSMWVKRAFLFWAFTISIAQIYVGLHYPLDILGGVILGAFIALCLANIFKSLAFKFS